jgi:putative acetyltransferase
MSKILIRKECPSDYHESELVCQRAFYNQFMPGCVEHYLLHMLRSDPSFVPELSRVATIDGRLVGGIYYTTAFVDDGRHRTPVLSFGPLFVDPSCQAQGVGARLIETTISLAKKTAYPAIIIFGHPSYYPRFGFHEASLFNIHPSVGEDNPALQIYGLKIDSLALVSGFFTEPSFFETITPEMGADYDGHFPPLPKKAPKYVIS